MRVRKLLANHDYPFGGQNEFFIDSAAGVAQAILTRLSLMTGEWFLDLDAGTDYAGSILGAHSQGTRDAEIRARIIDTPGVLSLDSYSSSFDPINRSFSVSAQVTTAYGQATFNL